MLSHFFLCSYQKIPNFLWQIFALQEIPESTKCYLQKILLSECSLPIPHCSWPLPLAPAWGAHHLSPAHNLDTSTWLFVIFPRCRTAETFPLQNVLVQLLNHFLLHSPNEIIPPLIPPSLQTHSGHPGKVEQHCSSAHPILRSPPLSGLHLSPGKLNFLGFQQDLPALSTNRSIFLFAAKCDKIPSQELSFVMEDGTNSSSLNFLTSFLAALHSEEQTQPSQHSH